MGTFPKYNKEKLYLFEFMYWSNVSAVLFLLLQSFIIPSEAQSITQDDRTKEVLDLLREGEGTIRYSTNKDVIILMGNTGSGKSTLTQFLAGNNDDLISQEVGKDTGEYIIIDRNNTKIGSNSTIDSFTIFPDLVIGSNGNVPFYDSPGFSDTRSAAHDIAATFFIKRIINFSRGIKFVVTVSYTSVRQGGDRQDFMVLVKHVVSTIKNIDKFKNSIALIVTKVENTYVMKNRNISLVPDDNVIENIANFLARIKSELNVKLTSTNDSIDKEFYKHTIQLINIFLTKTGQKYTKIGIFRRPNDSGQITNIALLQDGKKPLEQILYKNIQYSTHETSDFGYSISPNSQNHVHDLVEKINEYIATDIMQIGKEIEKYFHSRERQWHDIQELYDLFKLGHDSMSKIKHETTEFVEPLDFIKQIIKNVNDLKISVSSKNLQNIVNYGQYLNFLKAVSSQHIAKPLEWAQGLSTVIEYLDSSQKWYSFLNSLHDALSSFEVQQNITRYSNRMNYLKNKIGAQGNKTEIRLSLKEFLNQVMKKSHEKLYNSISGINMDLTKLKILNELLDVTLKYDVKSFCNNQTRKLLIHGQYVKLSDVAKNPCIKSKFIEIFALNRIFIDVDLNMTGEKVQLTIVAPIWDVQGSRKIILDGRSGEIPNEAKAKSGIGYGGPGKDGKPGLPGGPGGNFLGVGKTIINGRWLTISANGGNGAPGQHGGDGANGKDGDDPPASYPSDPKWQEEGFTILRMYSSEDFVPVIESSPGNIIWFYYVYGEGKNGGDGGNGGVGGKGGHAGDIKMITLEGDSNIILTNASGRNAVSGYGGRGGQGGKGSKLQFIMMFNELFGLIKSYKTVTNSELDEWKTVDALRKNADSGNPGADGVNSEGVIEPEKTLKFCYPSRSVNQFKSFFRSNLKNSIRESFLRDFLYQLENYKSVSDLYDTSGLVNELYSLEDQFYKLHSDMSFLPFYKSLLQRILQYAQQIDVTGASKEHKKVLSYLYTATLSKICSINNNVTSNLITDLRGYLDLAIDDINKLRDLSEVVSINNYKTNYQEVIDVKTNEAKTLIDTQITPEINNVLNKVDNQVELLVNETISLQQSSQEEKRKLLDKRQSLEKSLILRKLLGVIKISSQFLSFLGPIGSAGGAAIASGIMITESLALDDPSGAGTDKITALPSAVKNSVTRITDQFKIKLQLFKEQLHDAEKEAENFLQQQQSPNIYKIKNKILEAKEKLDKLIRKGAILDPAQLDAIYSLRKEVVDLLQDQKNALEKQKPNVDIKIEKQIRVVSNIQQAVSITEISVDFYGRIRNHQAKIEQVSDTLKQVNDKITKLEEYEKDIYNIIIPVCREIENSARSMVNNLQGVSRASLNIHKWQVQSTIKDTKLQLQKMIRGFNVEEDTLRCLDKLEEAMSIMINMYDHIENYQDQAELAAYISDVNSKKALDINLSGNKELNNAVLNLKLVIKSNLVLQRYEIAMRTFMQLIFPFADLYLSELNLPSSLQSNDTNNVVLQAVRKIQHLKSKMSESAVGINRYDKYIHKNVRFNSRNNQVPPFFVWRHTVNNHAISRLLEGEEVTMKSNIIEGLNKNSVKFNVIGIYFKLSNESLQLELNRELENFKVTITHLGYSYYRCNNKFYVMSHDNETIVYSFKKNSVGEPLNSNLVYNKLKRNNPVLSPYAMWTIKLLKINNFSSTLSKYKDQKIDLELEGHGEYIDQEINVCNDNLNKYYKLDDSISETNYINLNGESDILEIS